MTFSRLQQTNQLVCIGSITGLTFVITFLLGRILNIKLVEINLMTLNFVLNSGIKKCSFYFLGIGNLSFFTKILRLRGYAWVFYFHYSDHQRKAHQKFAKMRCVFLDHDHRGYASHFSFFPM